MSSQGTREKGTSKIKFNYSMSPSYKSYPIDGVTGGLNMKGGFYLDFFTEKLPLPKHTIQKVKVIKNQIQILGEPVSENVNSENIVLELDRDVCVGVVIDYPMAKMLRDWIDKQIKGYEKMSQSLPVTNND